MKWTAAKIRALKGGRKIAVLTAYDTLTASLVDAAGIPVVLVGDSLGMTVLGYETTLPVTITGGRPGKAMTPRTMGKPSRAASASRHIPAVLRSWTGIVCPSMESIGRRSEG